MYFLPWWALLACLAASAVAAYLLLGRTQAGDSRWALFALTAVAAPAVLAAAMAAAVVLSTLLSAYLWDQPAGRPEPAARSERTGGGATTTTTEGTDLVTTPERAMALFTRVRGREILRSSPSPRPTRSGPNGA